MSGAAVAVIVILAILLVAAIVLLMLSQRSARLRDRFGPEYNRAVERKGGRIAAERDLAQREARYQKLDIRPLDPAARERYAGAWDHVQRRFVDAPPQAITEAHQLVLQVMSDRGYPTDADFEGRADMLSVEHSRVLDNYRAAHRIDVNNREGRASTEDLRQGMVHYRALFSDLLAEPSTTGSGATTTSGGTPQETASSPNSSGSPGGSVRVTDDQHAWPAYPDGETARETTNEAKRNR